MQIFGAPSPLTRFCYDLESSFLSLSREGNTLTNGELLYKCQCPLQKVNFSFLSFSSIYFFSKIISSKYPYSKETYVRVAYSAVLHLFIVNFFLNQPSYNIYYVKHYSNASQTVIHLIFRTTLSGRCYD